MDEKSYATVLCLFDLLSMSYNLNVGSVKRIIRGNISYVQWKWELFIFLRGTHGYRSHHRAALTYEICVAVYSVNFVWIILTFSSHHGTLHNSSILDTQSRRTPPITDSCYILYNKSEDDNGNSLYIRYEYILLSFKSLKGYGSHINTGDICHPSPHYTFFPENEINGPFWLIKFIG